VPYVTVGEENSQDINIHFEDHGSGPPVVFVHGFLLGGQSFEKQEAALLEAGYRVVTYDRRGFGSSSRPSVGYEFDTFVSDLENVLVELELHDVTLVGFSIGAGEVIRHVGTFGSERVVGAVLLAPLPPLLVKAGDAPDGIGRLLDRWIEWISADRPEWIKRFLDDYYNIDVLGGHRVSDQAWQQSFIVASTSSATGTLECVNACFEDFRRDLSRIHVPCLIVQGDQDRIFPAELSGNRVSEHVENIRTISVAGGPHAIIWTHAEHVNTALLEFLATQLSTEVRKPTPPRAEADGQGGL